MYNYLVVVWRNFFNEPPTISIIVPQIFDSNFKNISFFMLKNSQDIHNEVETVKVVSFINPFNKLSYIIIILSIN